MLIEKLSQGKKIPLDETYDDDIKLIDFLDTSYEAKGTNYTLGEAPDGKIIHKNECEKREAYKERCKRTPTRSYVSAIINKYNAAVFRNEPSRQVDSPAYKEIYENADGYGTTLNKLMRESLLFAQRQGISYLLADSTASDTEILTIAQKNSSGVRPYIRKIERKYVVATNKVEKNMLEAIVLLSDEEGRTFARYMNDEIYIDMRINDKYTITDMGEPYSHGYSRLPLVLVEPFPSAQAEPIAYGQRTIVNILSQLSQERVKSVWTKHILSGVRLPQEDDGTSKPVISWSESEMVVLEDSGAKLDTLGADVACSDSLRKDIEQEEAQLYYAAGFGRANVEPTNLSGISRLIALEDFFSTCDALKKAIENGENSVMELIAEKEGFAYTPVVYSDKYLADDNGEAIGRVRDLLALDIPKTFKNLAIKEYISTFYNVGEEDMAKIEQELLEEPEQQQERTAFR